ncbi:urease accessory protein UreD [Sansalvadorimonas verongulae]|uniref:urease accessory protein UreD n=1 Tax=Sansalvadorimonas verongulae TaxID=2172824 RepID=UPI001E540DB0|nr:urease accessory protein UreD [Sansalvadorimonas verongulae]
MKSDGERSFIGRTRHYGPLRLQRPFFPEGNGLAHLYVLHPPGGLVAGDILRQSFTVRTGAAGLVTTPAAGKVYFNKANRSQRQEVLIRVEEHGVLEWLPQETILFEGCQAELDTVVHLSDGSSYIGWDIICLGRQASGEVFQKGQLLQTVAVYRDKRPLFRERLELLSNDARHASLLGLSGCSVFGSLIATIENEPDVALWHEQLIDQRLDKVTALSWRNGLLLARYLGHSSAQARKVFEFVWELCRPCVHGRPVCTPRIWST